MYKTMLRFSALALFGLTTTVFAQTGDPNFIPGSIPHPLTRAGAVEALALEAPDRVVAVPGGGYIVYPEGTKAPLSQKRIEPNGESFGTSYTTMKLFAKDISPQSDSHTAVYSDGWVARTSGTNSLSILSFDPPHGSRLYGFYFSAKDSDDSSNILWEIYRTNRVDNNSTLLASYVSTGTVASPQEDNNIFVAMPAGSINDTVTHSYQIWMWLPEINTALKTKDVIIWLLREMKAAPASASFSDVPTGYWAFRAIEALKASGVTTGYGDGTFKPDNLVTRAEMATFLSRALGLGNPSNTAP